MKPPISRLSSPPFHTSSSSLSLYPALHLRLESGTSGTHTKIFLISFIKTISKSDTVGCVLSLVHIVHCSSYRRDPSHKSVPILWAPRKNRAKCHKRGLLASSPQVALSLARSILSTDSAARTKTQMDAAQKGPLE